MSEYAVVSLAERSDLFEAPLSADADALAPLSVDRERDEPAYVEPGAWMLHP